MIRNKLPMRNEIYIDVETGGGQSASGRLRFASHRVALKHDSGEFIFFMFLLSLSRYHFHSRFLWSWQLIVWLLKYCILIFMGFYEHNHVHMNIAALPEAFLFQPLKLIRKLLSSKIFMLHFCFLCFILSSSSLAYHFTMNFPRSRTTSAQSQRTLVCICARICRHIELVRLSATVSNDREMFFYCLGSCHATMWASLADGSGIGRNPLNLIALRVFTDAFQTENEWVSKSHYPLLAVFAEHRFPYSEHKKQLQVQ